METVTISKEEYERMKKNEERLRKLEQIDYDLIRQIKASLEDVKHGRIRRVA